MSEHKTLYDYYPDLVLEWDFEKNYPLTPNDIGKSSKKEIWWLCNEKHSWKSTLDNRVNKEKGIKRECPFCSKKRASKDYNLKMENPELTKEWHLQKNKLGPEFYLPRSADTVWWLCENKHEWEQKISTRNMKWKENNYMRCPFCSGRRANETNSLEVVKPLAAKLFNSDKNGGLTPKDVPAKSGKKYWFKCQNGHEWQRELSGVKNSDTCFYCEGKGAPEKSLAYLFPKIANEFDAELNGDIDVNKLLPKSNKKIWWCCSDCSHKWRAIVSSRTIGSDCPKCGVVKNAASRQKTLLQNNNTFHDQYPDLTQYWDYEKNKNTPKDVSPSSNKIVWWKCGRGHSHQKSINSVTKRFHCKECFLEQNCIQNKAPELLKFWDYERNAELNPRNTTTNKHEQLFWKCELGHAWNDFPSNMVKFPSCPFCNKKRASGTHNLELVNPILAFEWNYELNFPKTPKDVTPGSHQEVWWTCRENPNHVWKTSIHNRSQGRGCRLCNNERQTSFPEQAIFYYLSTVFSNASNRYVFGNIKSNKFKNGVEVDIYIPELNLAIEYDGYLHHKSKQAITREVEKNKLLLLANITLLRIRDKKLSSVDSEECFILTHDYESPDGFKKTIIEIGEFIQTSCELDGKAVEKIEDWNNIDISLDTTSILSNMMETIKENSVASIPKLLKEWHPTLNGDLRPEVIFRGSGKPMWWICEKGHPYLQTPNKRSNPREERDCPFCTLKVNEKNSLALNYPKIAELWDYTKNGSLTPKDVTLSTRSKVFWVINGESVFESPYNLIHV